MINVALYQPDIPQNTAAIIRTCACFDIKLEIIKPAGFVLNEKKLNRIYMDYVKNCDIKIFESFSRVTRIKEVPIPKNKTPKAVKTEPNPRGFPLELKLN